MSFTALKEAGKKIYGNSRLCHFFSLSVNELCQSYAESLGYGVLIKLGADNAETTDNACAAETDVGLTGDIVEVEPSAVVRCNDSLGAKDHAVFFGICEALESRLERVCIEFLCCLCTVAYKDLVGVMVMVVVIVMVTAGAVAVFVVFVMMLMLVVVVVAALAVVVMFMLLVVVVVAALAVVMMMLMLVVVIVVAAFAVVVMMMLLVVIVVAAFAVVVMMLMLLVVIVVAAFTVVMMMLMLVVIVVAAFTVVVMMLVSLLGKLAHLGFKGRLALHSLKKLIACKLIPRGGNDYSGSVMLLEKRNAVCDLLLGNVARVAEHDTSRVLNLIIEELTEVLHVHLALVSVNDGGKAVENCALCVCILNRFDNVGELTNARGLDKYAVGSVFVDNLLKRYRKVANKRATDTSRVHFVDLDACLGEKTAVDTDLTEFVLDKDQLFAVVCFFYKLFDKSCLSCAEKAGKYVDFSHFSCLSE